MRQVVLDTETTGLDPQQGHRVIEIGCVEIQNRRLTGKHFHYYLNPDRDIDEAAIEVHGLTREFLSDKPRFAQIEAEFIDFVRDAELVIHNAPFDIGFLDAELKRNNSSVQELAGICSVLDSLLLAREKHPGQRNNLDALCKRYGVDNTQRELHGALLDAEILADVYLLMTSGQSSLSLKEESDEQNQGIQLRELDPNRPPLRIIKANDSELAAHQERLEEIARASGDNCLWLELDQQGPT
ncbi:MAG: DNA polymerase III subunit epsilon [Pseudomonadales bacterium]|jgi:DNA polymerase-3 subunit epsilon|nr:DNA polymerase III subunit epsilon [Pseudomonadales bacterium]